LAHGLAANGQGGFDIGDAKVLEPWSGRRSAMAKEILLAPEGLPDIITLQGKNINIFLKMYFYF